MLRTSARSRRTAVSRRHVRRRAALGTPVAALGTLAMAVGLLSMTAPAVAAPLPTATMEATSTVDADSRWVFDYTGNTQLFTVPKDVTALTMLVTGGAGANPNDSVGRGGASGLVLTRHDVAPGDVLTIWVGQGGVGGGGWGWGCGGDHGHAPDSLGRDGGGGGGASAVSRGGFPDGSDCEHRPDLSTLLAVGGGGGAGGGDGWVMPTKLRFDYSRGGSGGSGGSPAEAGSPALPLPDSPPPGCGGCASGPHGGSGGDATVSFLAAGGGGGGGGYLGGEGGYGGFGLIGGAGAGGGGGSSFDAGGTNTAFLSGDAVGDGQVILSVEPDIIVDDCRSGEFLVTAPTGLPLVDVHAEGGQGGTARDEQGGRGGYGGTVDGNVILTTDNPDLLVRAGCGGENGGDGYAEGGSHGVTVGNGFDGGTGGGATGISIFGIGLVAVAGGGGGGGGSTGAITNPDGGDGGNGGRPPSDGKDSIGDTAEGAIASGGAGGCQSSGHGGGGGDIPHNLLSPAGGGGGGGGGLHGGCGGEAGGNEGFGFDPGGGGGGGGGSSAATAELRDPVFGTSERAGDGYVQLSFGTMAISTTSGSDQRALINDAFARELTATVTDGAGNALPDVLVEFDLRGDGPGSPSGVFGLWDDGIQTKQVRTDAEGVAHSGVVTAGINHGAWTATAALPAITIDDVAHFQLKNDGLPTTTTAHVDPKPAQYMAPIIFTADVTTELRSAHGTVDFWVDHVHRYTADLAYTTDAANDSVATAVYTPDFAPDGLVLEPGEHTLHVVYGGDEAFAASGATTTFTVVDAQSTTAIVSSKNPATQFDDVTYDVTTTVPDGFAPLAGYDLTLTFASGAGTTVVQGTLDANGAYTTEPMTVPQNTEITAQVSGDGPVAGSSAGMFQYVIGDGDLVAVSASSSLNPAAPRQPIELTADLTPPAGGPAPTGTVRFTDGPTLLCETDVVAAAATCTGANPVVVGGHRIVATYSGDTTYRESYGLLYQQTIPGVTQTTVAIEPTESPVFGQPVSFTADVSLATGDTGGGELTGTVTFTVDGETLGDPVAVTADGTASSATIASLAIGEHRVVASYSGDENVRPSSGILDAVIWASDTDLALTASAEPSSIGESVTFTAAVTPTAPGAGTPAGTVQFTVDDEPLGDPVELVNGIAASTPMTALALGAHDIEAVYASSDANFMGSLTSITHRVVAQTHVQVSSSANPASYGAPVAVTATVVTADGTSVTGGTVAFTIDGVAPPACGAVEIEDGTAACDLIELSPGQYTVAVEYSGTNTLEASTGTLVQHVTEAATATDVASSANPSLSGEEVRFTATVSSPVSGIFSGTVQFLIDGFVFGDPVPVVDGAAVSEATSDLDTNTGHEITADYSGDANFAASSGAMTQWVGADRTVTTVTSSANPSTFAEGVTFTATVTAAELVPPGAVQFSVDGEPFGDLVPVTDGTATSAEIFSLGTGDHRIGAEFLPEAPFPSSSGTLVQTVSPAASSVNLSSSSNPSVFGSPVSFTATVTGDGPSPTGAVQFFVDGVAIGSPISLSDGVAVTAPVPDLSVGHHDVIATYLGDEDHSGASTTLLQRVTGASTTTTLTSSENPALVGTSVHFTATVASEAAGVPTGSVRFYADGAPIGAPVALVDGMATSAGIDGLVAGTHDVTGEYLGDGSHAASSATLMQRIFDTATTTEISSSAAPSVFGEPVTFTADVTGTATEVPTGTVQFTLDGEPLGDPVSLVDGSAHSPTVSDLSVADHRVIATYDGTDTDDGTDKYDGTAQFGPSTAELTQTVIPAMTTTTLSSSANPSLAEDAVTFTASVTAAAPSRAAPTGTVQFSVDGVDVGAPVAVNDGSASSEPVSGLAAGDHDIVAEYLGDSDFFGSADAITQTVVVGTVTVLTSSANPSTVGEKVAFSATVAEMPTSTLEASAALAAAIPAGTVQFALDGVPFGAPVATADGVAAFSIADLSAGQHTITATFTGDGFASSTGSVAQQVDRVTPPAPPVPPPPAPPHGGGDLPSTGGNFPVIVAGIGLLLVLGGGGLWIVVARRRR